jgi:hypothetical protein
MMMRNSIFERSVVLAGTTLIMAGLTFAQDAAKQSDQNSPGAHQQKPPSKPHKVWTDDDVNTIRRRGDITIATAQNATLPEAKDAPPEMAAKKPAEKSSLPSGKAALSNPATAAEADEMIAWEQRDIDAQQQYVDRVQEQLDQAPADQKEHFQKMLAERQKILADVRREQQQLIADRKALEKKASQGNLAASQSPQ